MQNNRKKSQKINKIMDTSMKDIITPQMKKWEAANKEKITGYKIELNVKPWKKVATFYYIEDGVKKQMVYQFAS